MNEFLRPMQPWPGLEKFGRRVALPRNGLGLFVYEAGDTTAPPMMLIHGLGDEADTWRHVIGPLADRQRILALDLPGFGRSDKPSRDYAIEFLCGAILETMDVLSIPAATLMGNSLGAMLAQAIALRHPERVDRLILVDGALVAREKPNEIMGMMAQPGVGEMMYNSLRGEPQTAYETLRPFYGHLDDLPEADRAFLYQRVNERVWSDGQRDAYLSILRQLLRYLPEKQAEFEAGLARCATLTQVVWGELDMVNPVENARALVSIQPSARLTVIPGAGHLPHQEKPEKFLRLILV